MIATTNDYSPNQVWSVAQVEVMGVAASEWHENLAPFSNFGSWVSVAAPGYNIISTLSYDSCVEVDCYGRHSSTSMASPHVASLAALVWTKLGASATNQDVRQIIQDTADKQGVHGQKFLARIQHGRINLASALAPTTPPPAAGTAHVCDPEGTATNNGGTWSASGAL